MVYGFAASVLPVWLLLTPRDYLSAFMKIGTILVLGTAIIVLMPPLKMPAITQFVDGTGPVFAGKWFPFAFITIACGAVSGFHALVASGTTPKMLSSEADATLVGYGSMLTESFVGLMAMIAAATLDPGVYFAMNVGAGTLGATADSAATKIAEWGFMVTPQQLDALATEMGEATLLSRTGGAPSLAVGMAGILVQRLHRGRPGALVSLRHHVRGAVHPHDDRRRNPRRTLHAAGAARPRLGADGAHVVVSEHPRLRRCSSWRAGDISSTRASSIRSAASTRSGRSSASRISCWRPSPSASPPRSSSRWVSFATRGSPLVPLVWLAAATLTAGWQKVFSAIRSSASWRTRRRCRTSVDPNAARMIFNDRLDAAISLFFMTIVLVVIGASMREWFLVASRRKAPRVHEAPFIESRLRAS